MKFFKEKDMANIKSAKKRVLIEKERRVVNNSVKSEIKTLQIVRKNTLQNYLTTQRKQNKKNALDLKRFFID